MRLTFRLAPHLLGIGLFVGACASAPTTPPETLLANLHRAMEAPVSTREGSIENSHLVQDTVDADALQGMRRFEVEETIGRGDPCSRHPRCAEIGFEDDDWFYTVGGLGAGFGGPVPLLIVGFDREGRVTRVWNLRTHD